MNKDFSSKHYAARTYEKMKEVFMDPTAAGAEIQYHMVRGGSDQRNITIWEPGKVGEEYIKTYGHYHVGNLDETYWQRLRFLSFPSVRSPRAMITGALPKTRTTWWKRKNPKGRSRNRHRITTRVKTATKEESPDRLFSGHPEQLSHNEAALATEVARAAFISHRCWCPLLDSN